MKQKEKIFIMGWSNKELIAFYKTYSKATKASQFHLKEKFEAVTNILRKRNALGFTKK